MFKFNNNHIFTGYLKQLLASFNLPKFRIYTEELEKQQEEYEENSLIWTEKLNRLQPQYQDLEACIQELKGLLNNSNLTEEDKQELYKIRAEYIKTYNNIEAQIFQLQNYIPKVIPTVYHSKYLIYPGAIPEESPLEYPAKMRYMPYLKDGCLQVYADNKWHECHDSFTNLADQKDHSAFHKNTELPYTRLQYTYGQKLLNYTKNLQIQNTVYDSYTHEYLGDYLRFHRDFANLNLMPLYNCFSNRACPHLNLSFEVGNGYEVKFKTDQSFETALYKYYMVPVKFFKDYTIAIDSEASIEVCCCIYDEYHNKDTDFAKIPKLTYQCFGDMQFKKPVLYTKIQNLTGLLVDPTNDMNDLCQQEDNLKLILKIPVNNNSSIVILEGDYTQYNDLAYQGTVADYAELISEQEWQDLLEAKQDDTISTILGKLRQKTSGSAVSKQTNRTIINYQTLDACEFLADKLITPLQLLRTNTGESYPFADRLVEYLVGNVITVNETILDNVVRAKTVIGSNCPADIKIITAEDGIWEPILQCLAYDYINKNQNLHDINHDILGFIDKDVEKWYAHKTFKLDINGNIARKPAPDNSPIVTSVETIANIDIYKDQWRN
jgi:hypothetical protein